MPPRRFLGPRPRRSRLLRRWSDFGRSGPLRPDGMTGNFRTSMWRLCEASRSAAAAAAEACRLPPDRAAVSSRHGTEDAPGELHFAVLGPLEVRDGLGPLALGPPKQRTLLGVLLARPNVALGYDQLVAALWGAGPPRTALQNLHVYVYHLRRVLGDQRRVERRGAAYALLVRQGELDAQRFEALADQARQARAPDRELLRQALALWRGPAFADLGEVDVLREAARRLEERRLGLLEERIETDLAAGRHAALVEELTGLVGEYPLRERFHAQLMLALYRAGRQAEALAAYQDARRLLVAQLGLEPGPELRRLEQAILRADPGLDHAPAPSLAGPAVGLVPAQLPPDVAGFTGRTEHLGRLDALLAGTGDAREGGAGAREVVITAIAGGAGVGKTALAVHWAHLAAGQFRSLLAGRRVLVVLDNARDAEQVRPLLPGSPGCLALVTSRDRLAGLVASHGASRLTLDVLPRGEAVALLARIVGQDRVDAEPEAAAGLAAACAHLPLALRIAAANLACEPDQPISAYLARLRGGDRLAELAVDGDPHAAVGGAFDCSYAALAADARRLFRLLGLVPGPELTAEAAAALADLPVTRAERLLKRLLDWYLHVADAAAGLLYPQILRLHASRAAAAPAAPFEGPDQALAWLDAERPNLVAAVQHAADAGLRPHAWLLADALRGYFWLRRDMVDWLLVSDAGLGAAVADGDPRAQAVSHLSRGDACHCSGRYADAIEHYGAGLRLARRAGWKAGHAATLGNLGNVHWDMGSLGQAAGHYTEALGLYQRGGDRDGQATALSNLGIVNRELGRLQQAAEQQAEALALFSQTGSLAGEALALSNLGEAEHALGRLGQASEHLNRALVLARETGSRFLEASALYDLAAVDRDAGRMRRALDLACAAVALANEIGDPRIEAETLSTLGSIHLDLSGDTEAIDRYEQALSLARQTGTRYAEADALLGLAAAHQHTGDDVQAIDHAQQALTIAGRAGFQVLEAQAHTVLAGAHLAGGRHDLAVAHAEQALALHRRTGHRLGQARTLVTLGHALRPADGAACWQAALALFTEIGSPEAEQVRVLLDAL